MIKIDGTGIYVITKKGTFHALFNRPHAAQVIEAADSAIEIKLECGVVVDKKFTVVDFGEAFSHIIPDQPEIICGPGAVCVECTWTKKGVKKPVAGALRITPTHTYLIPLEGFVVWGRRHANAVRGKGHKK